MSRLTERSPTRSPDPASTAPSDPGLGVARGCEGGSGGPGAAAPRRPGRSGGTGQASRAGKASVTGYFAPEIRRQLRRLAADSDTTIQGLLGVALTTCSRSAGCPKSPLGFDYPRATAGFTPLPTKCWTTTAHGPGGEPGPHDAVTCRARPCPPLPSLAALPLRGIPASRCTRSRDRRAASTQNAGTPARCIRSARRSRSPVCPARLWGASLPWIRRSTISRSPSGPSSSRCQL